MTWIKEARYLTGKCSFRGLHSWLQRRCKLSLRHEPLSLTLFITIAKIHTQTVKTVCVSLFSLSFFFCRISHARIPLSQQGSRSEHRGTREARTSLT